ncbi:MAG: SRPBCC family protein [Anaerolineae bacterium]
MKEIRVETEIAAPADRVWQVLTNFAAYPNWNPFIRRIEGRAKTDANLDVRIEYPTGGGMSFKPRVLRVQAGRELRWLGSLFGMPFLFRGEHAFTIEPLGKDSCRFVQQETVSGLLVPLYGKTIDGGWTQGFQQMNEALKARAEKTAG